MATFRYFAYGSNLLSTRLQARCPSARAVGTAYAAGFKVDFSKWSPDQSGKCNLTPTSSDSRAPGVIYEIQESEQEALDRAESSVPLNSERGYRRYDDFPVLLPDGEEIQTRTYRAQNFNEYFDPYDWYLALVLAGATEHNLDAEHLSQLRGTVFRTDRNSKGYEIALAALKNAGWQDWEKLLG